MKLSDWIKRGTAAMLSLLLVNTATVWPAHAQARRPVGQDAVANTDVARAERSNSSFSRAIRERPDLLRGWEVQPGIRAQVTGVSGPIAHVRITGRDASGPISGEIIIISEPEVSYFQIKDLIDAATSVIRTIVNTITTIYAPTTTTQCSGNTTTVVVVNNGNGPVTVDAGGSQTCTPPQ
jgi:hypothetical protein